MGTVNSASDILAAGKIFLENQEEALTKDGHQTWHRLVIHDFNDGQQFEGVIHKYETWSEPSDEPVFNTRGVRGDLRLNRRMVTYRGGNYWTLFPPLIWKALHAV